MYGLGAVGICVVVKMYAMQQSSSSNLDRYNNYTPAKGSLLAASSFSVGFFLSHSSLSRTMSRLHHLIVIPHQSAHHINGTAQHMPYATVAGIGWMRATTVRPAAKMRAGMDQNRDWTNSIRRKRGLAV